MRIKVTDGGSFRLNLPLLSGLVLNPVTASFLPRMMEKNGVHLTAKQARMLVKGINSYRKAHPEWVLVEVTSASGEEVMVKL